MTRLKSPYAPVAWGWLMIVVLAFRPEMLVNPWVSVLLGLTGGASIGLAVLANREAEHEFNQRMQERMQEYLELDRALDAAQAAVKDRYSGLSAYEQTALATGWDPLAERDQRPEVEAIEALAELTSGSLAERKTGGWVPEPPEEEEP